MSVGAKIQNLRLKSGLSLRGLAKAAGNMFSGYTLRRWEAEQQSPRVDELEKVAEVLGVKVEELLA